jgi:hypothetical protein
MSHARGFVTGTRGFNGPPVSKYRGMARTAANSTRGKFFGRAMGDQGQAPGMRPMTGPMRNFTRERGSGGRLVVSMNLRVDCGNGDFKAPAQLYDPGTLLFSVTNTNIADGANAADQSNAITVIGSYSRGDISPRLRTLNGGYTYAPLGVLKSSSIEGSEMPMQKRGRYDAGSYNMIFPSDVVIEGTTNMLVPDDLLGPVSGPAGSPVYAILNDRGMYMYVGHNPDIPAGDYIVSRVGVTSSATNPGAPGSARAQSRLFMYPGALGGAAPNAEAADIISRWSVVPITISACPPHTNAPAAVGAGGVGAIGVGAAALGAAAPAAAPVQIALGAQAAVEMAVERDSGAPARRTAGRKKRAGGQKGKGVATPMDAVMDVL